MEVNAILQGYALVLLVGLPFLAVREVEPGPNLRRAAEFRRTIYASIAASLILVAAVTLAVAWWQGVPAETLGWRVGAMGTMLAWSAGMTAAGLLVAAAVSGAARALGFPEGGLAFLLMPRDAREKRAFLVLAGVGSVCEEYIFRGFLLQAVAAWSGQVWVGVAATSAAFGLAHGYQRTAGIVRATALGLVLAWPVVQTGSLFPAVVAHFWINAVIGLGGWKWLTSEEERRAWMGEEEG